MVVGVMPGPFAALLLPPGIDPPPVVEEPVPVIDPPPATEPVPLVPPVVVAPGPAPLVVPGPADGTDNESVPTPLPLRPTWTVEPHPAVRTTAAIASTRRAPMLGCFDIAGETPSARSEIQWVTRRCARPPKCMY